MLLALFSFMGVGAWAEQVTDVLNQNVTGVTGTSYATFSDKQVNSDAVYAGQCAGDKSSIQLRSKNSNCGVITTTSGGTVKKIVVEWNSATNAARELNIYGSNTAYSNATDLYAEATQGTLIGTLKISEATDGVSTLEVEDSYAYIAFRSKSDALYLTSVSITWETNAVLPVVEKPVITPATGTYFSEQTVTITAEEGAEIYYTLNGGGETKYEAPFVVDETTTIVAYAKKGEDESSQAKATLTFGPVYDNLAAANAAATNDRVVSRVNFTEALVTFVSGQNAYIQDVTGAMLIYGNTELKVGDKMTGFVQGQLYAYNGLPEVANPTVQAEVLSSGNIVIPSIVEAAELVANPLKYVSQYVGLTSAVFAEAVQSSEKVNYTFQSKGTELILRNNFQIPLDIKADTEYAIAGLVTIFKDAVQIYPTDEKNIVETSTVPTTTNLDFETMEPIADGICTYARDMNANGTVHFGAQPLDGWDVLNITDNVYEGADRGVLDQKAAGVFAYGSEAWLGGKDFKVPAAGPEESTGTKCLGLVSVWGGENAVIQYTQDIVLQPGNYEIQVPVMNVAGTNALTKNLIGFIAENGTEYLAKTTQYPVGEWKTENITFKLTEVTSGKLSIGIQNGSGSAAAPHLFIDQFIIGKIDPADAARMELNDDIYEASNLLLQAPIGESLMQIPNAAAQKLQNAITAQQSVLGDENATAEQLETAIETLKEAVEAFEAARILPNEQAEYVFQLKEGGMYLTLNEGTKLAEEPAALKFVTVEGGYAITNGTEYVACTGTGTNTWSMAVATEPYAWNITMQEGYYTLAKSDNPNHHIGVDYVTAGSACYANKGVSDKSLWSITLFETPVEPEDVTSLIKNPAYLENGYDGWTYSENGFKVRNYEVPMNLVTYSGNADFELSQTIENVPAGLYRLTVNAFYRAGSLDNEKALIEAGTELPKNIKLYANNETEGNIYSAKVMNLSEGATDIAYGEGTTQLANGKFVPNSAAESRAWYIAGEYTNEVLFNVFEDGATLTIGLSKAPSLESDYAPIGAWKLYRLGMADANKAQPETPDVNPEKEAYERALAALEDGKNYSIATDVDGEHYFLTASGTLTKEKTEAGAFTFKKVEGKEWSYGFQLMEPCFTNPDLVNNEAVLNSGRIRNNEQSIPRTDWEAQVFFLNEEGKYAVRATNAAGGDSGWNLVAKAFWTVNAGEQGPIAEYSFDKNYVWQIEENTLVNVTMNLVINGEVAATETQEMAVGFEPEAPAAFKEQLHGVYKLASDVEVITAETTTINFSPVWNGIFDFSEGFENAKWYNMTIRTKYYVAMDETEPYYPNENKDLELEASQWAFVPVEGEPYQIVIYNRAAGSGKTLANDNGNVVMRADIFKWEIFGNNDGFVLRPAEGENRDNMWVNQNGGASGPLQFWNNTNGRTDNGSTFRVSEAPAPKTELELALNVDRYVGMGYGVTETEVDFAKAKFFLGVEELTEEMLTIINPDGNEVAATSTDGWFNAEGVATGWAPEGDSKINVKFFEAIPDGKFSICDMNGADVEGQSYEVKWALSANGKKVIYTIKVSFVPAPVKFLADYTQKGETIDVALYPAAEGQAYEAVESETFEESVVSELIGEEWEDIYGVGAKVDDKATLTNVYSCDPAPGFWCLTDGTADIWSNSTFGVSLVFSEDYSTFTFLAWSKSALTEPLKTIFYLVNEQTKEYVAYEITLNTVPTGINNFSNELENAIIFDLSGRKLYKVQKGVNIINSRKVVVK